MQNTIKLKHGEYYELKITDANKNVINQVEITPVNITTDVIQLSHLSSRHDMGESLRNAYDRGMTAQQKELDCFNTWQYVRQSIPFHSVVLNIPAAHGVGQNVIAHRDGTDPLCKGRQLDVEVQVRKRFWITKMIPFPKRVTIQRRIWLFGWRYIPMQVWKVGFKPFRFKSQWMYSWNNVIATPIVLPITNANKLDERIVSSTCSISLNREQLKAMSNVDSKEWADIQLLNWRYKLTGGEVNIENAPKQVYTNFESQLLRGVHSYTYPESTLIQESARVGNANTGPFLTEHIARHILSRYANGRATMKLKWQGDPSVKIGSSIVLEDKMGIETEYMVTGNQFVLDSNGKFFMHTEGISTITVPQ